MGGRGGGMGSRIKLIFLLIGAAIILVVGIQMFTGGGTSCEGVEFQKDALAACVQEDAEKSLPVFVEWIQSIFK